MKRRKLISVLLAATMMAAMFAVLFVIVLVYLVATRRQAAYPYGDVTE